MLILFLEVKSKVDLLIRNDSENMKTCYLRFIIIVKRQYIMDQKSIHWGSDVFHIEVHRQAVTKANDVL